MKMHRGCTAKCLFNPTLLKGPRAAEAADEAAPAFMIDE
jgi:hypothetical protein